MAKKRPLKVDIPEAGAQRPAWMRVGVLSAVGLIIGVAWPTIAGMRLGPQLPGAKTAAPAAATAPVVTGTAMATTSALPPPSLAKSAPSAEQPSNKQTVVVGGGVVSRCHQGRKLLKKEQCGKLRVDRVFSRRLQELAGCPSSLGLAGELELGFDINFDKKVIKVTRGKRGDLPSTTVNGIVACVADYISDVNPDRIPHKHSRYKVSYTLSFYPPGSAPPREGTDEAAGEGGGDSSRGMGTVTWDTALIRDEPRTGDVIARLVRGARVKILGRRKDWYRVKIRSKEGWVYRGALGQ